jgi:hypothetical protein|tara:strand:- start:586 stop:825 length:240 start_codon:yes stop_codon:yes gene_type:complete
MSDLEKQIRKKTILEEYVLDKTDLDEKALKAIDDVEAFLNQRKDNVGFVWNKFRKTAYIFIFAGAVCGYIISLILQSLT